MSSPEFPAGIPQQVSGQGEVRGKFGERGAKEKLDHAITQTFNERITALNNDKAMIDHMQLKAYHGSVREMIKFSIYEETQKGLINLGFKYIEEINQLLLGPKEDFNIHAKELEKGLNKVLKELSEYPGGSHVDRLKTLAKDAKECIENFRKDNVYKNQLEDKLNKINNNPKDRKILNDEVQDKLNQIMQSFTQSKKPWYTILFHNWTKK